MKRYADWKVRLNDYLTSFKPAEEVNCAAFTADAVVAMTGEDPLAEIGRGSPEELMERFSKQDFASVDEKLASIFEQIHPNLAQVGDIALMKGRDVILGVVIGGDIQVLGPDGNIGIIPLKSARAVFRV